LKKMKIDFYEEFPLKQNLHKLKQINFPCRLFLASHSIKEFRLLEKQVKTINKKIEVCYWPIVKNSYWISPFSNPKDLKELFKELESCNNKILIDLELPLNKKLIIKNLFNQFSNRKRIRYFLENNKERITTAQFPSSIISTFMKIIGLDYKVKTEKSFMWYSSMTSKKMNNNIKENLVKIKDKSKISISLGTVALGILGNEPILSPKNLKQDLDFVKNAGFDRVIIFRLGGLNPRYLKVLKSFLD